MQTLGRELPRAGVDASVIIPDSERAEELQRWFVQNGARCDRSNELGRITSSGIRGAPAFAQFLRSQPVDVVNIHSPGPHLPIAELIAARLASLPAVVSVPGLGGISSRRFFQVIRNRFVAARLADAVVVITTRSKDEQISFGVPRTRLAVIRNGVPVVAGSTPRDVARDRLGIDSEAFVILSFGRLVKDKGIDTLIAAVEHFSLDLQSKALVLIGGTGANGGNPFCDSVGPFARNIVKFIGHVDDTSRYYEAADLFVLPSRHEPFGLVFIEAAQHGVPSIGTNIGGIPEAIVHGLTGYLVPPDQPLVLATKIGLFSKDPLLVAEMGHAAKERARSIFTEVRMVSDYSTVFQKIVAEKTREGGCLRGDGDSGRKHRFYRRLRGVH